LKGTTICTPCGSLAAKSQENLSPQLYFTKVPPNKYKLTHTRKDEGNEAKTTI